MALYLRLQDLVLFMPVLYFLTLFSVGKSQNGHDLIFLVNRTKATDRYNAPERKTLLLECGATDLVKNVLLFEGSLTSPLQTSSSQDSDYFHYVLYGYYIKPQEAVGCKVYRCQGTTYTSTTSHNIYINLTIDFGGCPGPTNPTSPTNGPSTDSGGSKQKFTGLKPLIYTVASVILLGTLAIVAIITCWIRARRSFNNRLLRPNNTPQDYLDYINDNEFTPLTTSEFLASLQERPPTYNQSEEMTQDGRATVASSETTANASSTTETNHSTTQTATQTATSSRREGRASSGHRGRARERQRHTVGENSTAASTGSDHNTMTEPSHTGNDGQENADSSRELPSLECTSDQHSQQADSVEELIDVSESSQLTATQPDPMSSPTQDEIEAIEAFVSRLELLTPTPSLPNSSDMVDTDFSAFVSSSAPPSSV